MIYCPKCGTANRDGSRFCNECGQRLGAHTRVRCPQCGTFNPIKNVFCEECGAGLLPAHREATAGDAAAPIKGLSLPTKGPVPGGAQDPADDVPDEEEDVPAWLRELGSTWSVPGAAEPAPEEGDEIPDWLKDLRESLPEDRDAEPARDQADEAPDWLVAMHTRPSAPSEPESADLSAEVPDWLAEVRGPAADEEPARSIEPEDDSAQVPDWLADLRGPAAANEPPRLQPQEPGLPASDLPDWLAALRPTAVEAPAEAGGAPAGGGEEGVWDLATSETVDLAGEPDRAADELPDWLAALRGPAPDKQPPPPEPAGPDLPEPDVPDWLAALRGPASDKELPPPEPAGPDLPEPDVPDWLAALRPRAIEEPEVAWAGGVEDSEPESEYSRTPSGELPDWLAELRGPVEKEPPAPPGRDVSPVPPAAPIEEAEVPDWLGALRPSLEVESPPVPPPSSPASGREKEAAAGQIPDWLAALRPPEADDLHRAGPGPAGEAGGEPEPFSGELSTGEIPDWLVPSDQGIEEEPLARAEIPDWLLALKPAALRAEGEPAGPSVVIEEPVEETGILAGLQGTLPVEMLIAQPRAVKAPVAVEAPVTDSPNARLFAEIVGSPAGAAPKVIAQPRRPLLSLLPRWLFYIALIGVVALPLLVDRPLLPRELSAAAPVTALYDRIAGLDENSVVLVAFDYDPTYSGEMDVLARALVGGVMDRGARVVAVSTLPAGPATAEKVLDDLAAGRPLYDGHYGEIYANLGFIPGQAAAVRLLSQSLPLAVARDFYATPIADLPVLDGVVSAAGFDLILELAATQETLRAWVEQAGAPYAVPLAAGASGSIEPFARAYYQADPAQLVGLVAGVPGAASYETLASGEAVLDDALAGPGTSWAARLDSLLGGHLVFIAVLLVGGMVGLLRRDAGREA